MVDFLHGGVQIDLPPGAWNGEVPEFLQGSYRQAKEDPEDANLSVTFGRMAKLMSYKTKLAGYPVFENVDTIKIRFYKDGVWEEVINEIPEVDGQPHWKRVWYTSRFPKHWDKFQKNFGPLAEGTPVSLIVHDPSIQATLQMAKVVTLEQLAEIQGTILNLPGIPEAKKKAKTYLDSRSLVEVEAAERKTLVEELEAANQELQKLKQVISAKEDEPIPDDTANSTRGRKARNTRKA